MGPFRAYRRAALCARPSRFEAVILSGGTPFASSSRSEPSRSERGAEEGPVLDREPTGRRIRARRACRRCGRRHAAERCTRVRKRCPAKEALLRDGSRPAPQGGPPRRRRVAPERLRAHPPPHLGRRRVHETPEGEREADRGGAVQAPGAHLARNDDEHGTTLLAAVTPCLDFHGRGRLLRTAGTPHLAPARAVAMESQRQACRATRQSANRTLRRPDLLDRRQPLLPALDLDRALDDTVTASILRHTNRSRTRRLSGKEQVSSSSILWSASRRCSAPMTLRVSLPSTGGKKPAHIGTAPRQKHASGHCPVCPQDYTGFRSPPAPPSCDMERGRSPSPLATSLRRRNLMNNKRDGEPRHGAGRQPLAITDDHHRRSKGSPSTSVSDKGGIGLMESEC